MEMTTIENSQPSSFSSSFRDSQSEDPDQYLLSHGDEGKKRETTDEEVKEMLEVIATTGKFWHDWDTLKSLLSFQLKQVLSEYPEAKMANDQQSSLLGETHAELVKRLDEALLSFMEGPPFTLQRLSEILLAARSIYPNLSKLALALEKAEDSLNLWASERGLDAHLAACYPRQVHTPGETMLGLRGEDACGACTLNLSVSSTLSMATDPCPSMKQKPDEPANGNEDLQGLSNPIQNGVEGMAGDRDEEMVEAEEVEEDNKDTDMEVTSEMTGGTQETRSDRSTNSEPSTESSLSSEQLKSVGS